MDTYPHQRRPFKRTVMSSLIALGVSTPALAARYEVNNGSANNIIPGGTSWVASGAAQKQAAVRAVNPGSHLSGEDLDINAGLSGYGVVAENGGAVDLTGDNTRIAGNRGFYADGAGSAITMDGGTIETVNEAVAVHKQAEVLLRGVSIKYNTTLGRALSVIDGGSLSMTGKGGVRSRLDSRGGGIALSGDTADTTLVLRDTDITTEGDAAHSGGTGIESDTRSNVTTITLDNVNIETKGNNAMGLRLQHGTATLTDTHIVTHGEQTAAGRSVVGIYADAQNDSQRSAVVQMQGGSVTVHGKTAWGVGAVNGGVLDMEGVTLEKTSAGNSTAYVLSGGSLTFRNGSVNSAGVVAFWHSGNDGDMTVQDSDVHTSADGSMVVLADAVTPTSTTRIRGSIPGSNTLNAAGERSTLVRAQRSADVEIENTTSAASGDKSRGVWVQSQDAAATIGGVPGGVGRFAVKASDFTLAGKESIGVSFQAGTVLNYADAQSVNRVDISDGSSFKIDSGYGVVAKGGVNTLNVDNSTIDADRLIEADNLNQPDPANPGGTPLNTWGTTLDINASNHSKLSGHTWVSEDSRLTMNLQSGSTWMLKPSTITTSTQGSLTNGTRQSDVSILNLNDASIVFAAPATGSDYQDTDNWQTLVVGSGSPGTQAVYNASGNAHITMNALLNEGGELSNQYTDRLLIHGDVTGTTLVTVNPVANGELGAVTSTEGAHLSREGITVIQVSGNASPTSFKLNGEYVALGGKPWQYRLYAYGPHPTETDAAHPDAVDRAHPDQRLVDETTPGVKDDHWGFRLQNNAAPPPDPDDPDPPPVPDPIPVPQVANYVLAPVALFSAGLQDMGALHKRLGEIRDRDDQPGEVVIASLQDVDLRARLDDARADKARGAEGFLRAYGQSTRQVSYRADALTKGRYYDTDIRYHAIQGGVSFTDVQNDTNRVRFGLLASVGNLRQTPKSVEGARKTDLKAWAVSPYMTWQHSSGAYVDVIGLLGKFHGDVTTTQRGRTAKVGGNRYGVSVEAGLPVALESVENVTVTPQVQVAYQRLKFDATRDVDGFPVDVGTPAQVAVRAGAEVQKTLAGKNPMRIYGKVHVVKHFDRNQKVWLGETFTRGTLGAHVEAGAGVRAGLVKGAGHAYAEVNRRQRIGSHGAQGWTFSVGVKLPF